MLEYNGQIKQRNGWLTDECREWIATTYENGAKQGDIAKYLDVSPDAVGKACKKAKSNKQEQTSIVNTSTQALASRAQKLNGIDSLDYRVNLIIAAITPEKVAETKSIKDLTSSLKTLFEIQRLHEGKSTKNVSTQTSITGLIESLDDTRKRLRAKRTDTNTNATEQ